jgi:hypothetical protein
VTLTREQIEQIPAGPELDRLVAEALDGFMYPWDPASGQRPQWWPCKPKGPWGALAEPIPKFSEEIAAAWVLWEAMADSSLEPSVHHSGATHDYYTRTGDRSAVLVRWHPKEGEGEYRYAGADGLRSAPLAICRAFLIAKLAAKELVK